MPIPSHIWLFLMKIAGSPSSEWRRVLTDNAPIEDIANFAYSQIVGEFFQEGLDRKKSLRSESVWNELLEKGRLTLMDAEQWSSGRSDSHERQALLFILLMRHPAEMLSNLSIKELRSVYRIVMARPALEWDGVIAAMESGIDLELLRVL
jgi:hypothetical protein